MVFISQNPIWWTKGHIVCTFLPPQQDLSKRQSPWLTNLESEVFYVFRKDRQCKFIFLLSPSLDLINIISVRALEEMKVAGETLQRSQHTSPAARSYLQPWVWLLIISLHFTSLHLVFRGFFMEGENLRTLKKTWNQTANSTYNGCQVWESNPGATSMILLLFPLHHVECSSIGRSIVQLSLAC